MFSNETNKEVDPTVFRINGYMKYKYFNCQSLDIKYKRGSQL